MKTTPFSISFALAGALVLAAGTVSAQQITPLVMKFRLTAQAQRLANEPVGRAGVQKSTIARYRVTTKDVLNMLETAANFDFIPGDRLVVDDNVNSDTDGDFFAVDFDGNVLTNVTTAGFLSNFFSTESDGYVYKGNENTVSGSFDYVDVFLNTIQFEDSVNTNSFTFGGSERFGSFYNGTNGRFRDSFTLTGAGSGDLETNPGGGAGVGFFVLTGYVTGGVRGFTSVE